MKWRFCRPASLSWRSRGWRRRIAGAQTVGATRCGTGVHESEATVRAPSRRPEFLRARRGSQGAQHLPQLPSRSVPDARRPLGCGDEYRDHRRGRHLRVDSVRRTRRRRGFSARRHRRHLRAVRRRYPSTDLINTDYIIGVPLTFRRSGFSLRTKLCTELSSRRRVACLRAQESNARIYRSNRSKCSPPSR